MTIPLKNKSFPEKVIWVNLITTVLLFGYYFLSVLTKGLDGGTATWLYLKVVFWVIVIEIVVISVLSIFEKNQKGDERDKGIETRGYKWGYFVLIAGMMAALWNTIIAAVGDAVIEHPEVGEQAAQAVAKLGAYTSPLLIVHIILFTLVLAEITKAAAQLFYYRRGF